MPATVRIELFPLSVPEPLTFYMRILGFTLLRLKSGGDYADLGRDGIRICLSGGEHGDVAALNEEDLRKRLEARTVPLGTEIVIEVDDVQEERDRVVQKAKEVWGDEWKRKIAFEDLKWRESELRDFRVSDPDGYYLRMTGRIGKYGNNLDP